MDEQREQPRPAYRRNRQLVATRFAPKPITLPASLLVLEISAVQPRPDDPRLVAVRAGRKTIAIILDHDAREMRLAPGVKLDDALLEKLSLAAARAKARMYAINALSSRAMTGRTLSVKLRQRGLPETDAKRIVTDLTALGLINDAVLARTMTESQLRRKPAGKSLLINKLRAKGVEQAIAKTAVERVLKETDHDPRAGALDLAKKKVRVLARVHAKDPKAAQRRLYGMLARRGFDAETCAWATRQALGELDESE
jgi:regulatory protein